MNPTTTTMPLMSILLDHSSDGWCLAKLVLMACGDVEVCEDVEACEDAKIEDRREVCNDGRCGRWMTMEDG